MFFSFLFTAYASPLEPSNSGEESYSETYTAFVDLEDGGYLLLQYLFTNAGFGSDKGACRLLAIPSGKKGVNSSVKVSKKDWSYSNGNLKVGECYLKQSASDTVFYVKTDQGTATVQFDDVPKSIRSTDAKIVPKKGEYYEGDLLIPWSNVSATYRFAGATWSSKGKAQLDHTRSNTLLPKVANGWYRFRGFYGEKPLMFQVRITPTGTKKAWVMFDKAGVQTVEPAGITISKGEMPSLKVTFKDGSLDIKADKMLYEYKPTESYGALGTLAKPWVGNPVTTTFQASGTNSGTAVRGILEVATLK